MSTLGEAVEASSRGGISDYAKAFFRWMASGAVVVPEDSEHEGEERAPKARKVGPEHSCKEGSVTMHCERLAEAANTSDEVKNFVLPALVASKLAGIDSVNAVKVAEHLKATGGDLLLQKVWDSSDLECVAVMKNAKHTLGIASEDGPGEGAAACLPTPVAPPKAGRWNGAAAQQRVPVTGTGGDDSKEPGEVLGDAQGDLAMAPVYLPATVEDDSDDDPDDGQGGEGLFGDRRSQSQVPRPAFSVEKVGPVARRNRRQEKRRSRSPQAEREKENRPVNAAGAAGTQCS